MPESENLFIDDDWKAQAEREKLQASQQLEAAPTAAHPTADGAPPTAGGPNDPYGLPSASFAALVEQMFLDAAGALGLLVDPRTGRQLPGNLEAARYHIDMLGVLHDKTQGNLTDEESALLNKTLYQLRMRYVELTNAVAQAVIQKADKAAVAGPAAPKVPGGPLAGGLVLE